MPVRPITQHGRRFPAVVIHYAVWLYLRFPLSLRDVEELLAERGIEVSHKSVRRWMAIHGPRIAAELYAAAKQRIPQLERVEHEQVRSRMRCNNRVEQAHQPTRIRERRMGGFRCPISAQRFLSAFTRICNLFRPRRHLLRASEYRMILRNRFATWREVAVFTTA